MKGLLMKELSPNSMFNRATILTLLQRADGTIPVPPAARENAGVRFLVVANFHDADLLAVNMSERYGRPHVAVTVDFGRGDASQFKNGYRQFVLRFTDVRNFVMPKFNSAMWIRDVWVEQRGDRIVTEWQLTYFVGNEPRSYTLTIDCGGVEVAAM